MAVVMEITNQRYIDPHAVQMGTDFRNGRSGFRRIYGNPHQFRPRTRQFGALNRRPHHVNGIRIGHRLDNHRRSATDPHLPNGDSTSLPPVRRFTDI